MSFPRTADRTLNLASRILRGYPERHWNRSLNSLNPLENMHRSSLRRFRAAIPAFMVMLLSACETAEREPSLTELRASRQELRLQFASLNNQIRPTEMQALDSPSVQVAQAAFRRALEARMVEIDPQAAAWFEEAEQLGTLIASAPTDTSLSRDDKRRMAEDLQRLERTMGPVQSQAMQDSVVAERFRTLQDSMMEMVMRIHPESRPILANMRDLEERILELDRKIARRSGGAPGSEVSQP